MTNEQKNKIKHFLTRPLMYIYQLEEKQIIAFICGLEIGDEKIRLTSNISEVLDIKEKIKKDALGWPRQVQKYADKKNINWFDAFKLLSMEVIDNN